MRTPKQITLKQALDVFGHFLASKNLHTILIEKSLRDKKTDYFHFISRIVTRFNTRNNQILSSQMQNDDKVYFLTLIYHDFKLNNSKQKIFIENPQILSHVNSILSSIYKIRVTSINTHFAKARAHKIINRPS